MNIQDVTNYRVSNNEFDWQVASHIKIKDVPHTSVPWTVQYGNVTAKAVLPLLGEDGLRALFDQVPPQGATLKLAWGSLPLEEVGFPFAELKDEPQDGDTPIA